ncbi:ribbon-helix-helix protein, CopG family [Gordonia sp. ABKF26]|uniref:ribbon-helix-helix protein, CopG family n=1 Tax=Gordonia sp. ABKF26 TaxID=3238687 RepID=UPI0034E4477F
MSNNVKGAGHRRTQQVTVKLGEGQAETLEVLALLAKRGTSQADLIREAISKYHSMRQSSPTLAKEIEAAHRRLDALVAPLTGGPADEVASEDRVTLGDPVTLKIDASDYVKVEALAVLDGVKLADVVRTAVAWYTDLRKSENSVIATMINEVSEARAKVLAGLS